MGKWTQYALAGILAVATTSVVRAADLPFPPAEPMDPPIEFAGTWYLRGDVGVGALDFSGSVARDASTPAAAYVYNRIQDTVTDQVFVGVGFGYQFNSWLRFDATGEYRTKSDWRFIAQDITPGTPGTGFNLEQGHFSSIVGLANVYFDLFHYSGVTGFVGAGVGVAHHMFGSTTDIGLGSYTGGFGYGAAHDTTNFAWALHAGLSYDIAPSLKLELAYRYLNMGDARTGSVACLPTCALQTIYTVRELESHDIKLGMRWMFGGPVGYEMPPLVRKY